MKMISTTWAKVCCLPALALLLAGSANAEVDYSIVPKPLENPDSSSTSNEFELHNTAQLKLSISTSNDDTELPGWSAAIDESASSVAGGELPISRVRGGVWYFAGLEFDRYNDTRASQSASGFVSSRQLGVHYGRLGSISYSGVDLGFERRTDRIAERANEDQELWSLGVTTGKRFSLTGLGASDPLWTLSLRGQFNFEDSEQEELLLDNQSWYFSPGFHWQRDSFRLSADVLVPFMQTGEFEDTNDYSIRAQLLKRF